MIKRSRDSFDLFSEDTDAERLVFSEERSKTAMHCNRFSIRDNNSFLFEKSQKQLKNEEKPS